MWRPKHHYHYNFMVIGLIAIALSLYAIFRIFFSHAAANDADINSDGVVDVRDLAVLASNFRKTGQNFAQGDLNGDGTVDIQDFSVLALNWGLSTGGGGGGSCPTGWPVGAPCAATTGPAADGHSSLTAMTSGIWTANYGTWSSTTEHGVTLTTATVTHAGATISGYDINAQVVIAANNVTLRDSKIHVASPGIPTCGTDDGHQADNQASMTSCGSPWNDASANNGLVFSTNYDGGNGVTGITLAYDELDCGGITAQSGPKNVTYQTPYEFQEGIGYGHYTADHLNIHGCGNDALMRTDAHLTNSYLWQLAQNSSCFLAIAANNAGNNNCDHLDTIEATTGTANVGGATSSNATGNYLVNSWSRCIWLSAQDSSQNFTNMSFTNNWCAASGTFYAVGTCTSPSNLACGSAGAAGILVNDVIKNNRYVRYSAFCCTDSGGAVKNSVAGLNTDAAIFLQSLSSSTASTVTVCGNVWDDNNAIIADGPNAACP